MTLLVGRVSGSDANNVQGNKLISPGSSTGGLVLSGFAPAIEVTTTQTFFLNHFNETDASISLSDVVAGIVWTIENTAEIDTAQMKFGTSSVFIPNGTDEYITASNFTLDTATVTEYTFEGFVRWDGTFDASSYIGASLEDPVNGATFWLQITSSGNFVWGRNLIPGSSGFGSIDPLTTVQTDTWYHWALVKSTSGFGVFFNGNRINFESTAGICFDHTEAKLHNFTNNSVNVWFDETRLVGDAVYTEATYSIPSGEFSL